MENPPVAVVKGEAEEEWLRQSRDRARFRRGVHSVRQNDCNYAIFWFIHPHLSIPRREPLRNKDSASADHNGLVGGSSPAKLTTLSF